MKRKALAILALGLSTPVAAQMTAPFCLVTDNQSYCQYWSLASCEVSRSSMRGQCVANPQRILEQQQQGQPRQAPLQPAGGALQLGAGGLMAAEDARLQRQQQQAERLRERYEQSARELISARQAPPGSGGLPHARSTFVPSSAVVDEITEVIGIHSDAPYATRRAIARDLEIQASEVVYACDNGNDLVQFTGVPRVSCVVIWVR